MTHSYAYINIDAVAHVARIHLCRGQHLNPRRTAARKRRCGGAPTVRTLCGGRGDHAYPCGSWNDAAMAAVQQQQQQAHRSRRPHPTLAASTSTSIHVLPQAASPSFAILDMVVSDGVDGGQAIQLSRCMHMNAS